MEFLLFLGGAALGGLLCWGWFNRRLQQHQTAFGNETTAKQVAEARLLQLENQLQQSINESRSKDQQLVELSQQNSRLNAELRFQQEKLDNQQQEIASIREKFTLEFKAIANELLEDKSKRFTEQNQLQLDQLLGPLRERLKDFEQKVDSTHKESIEKHASLFNELKNLKELNQHMSEEARKLTQALKGESKTQGNWGEVILERILERSGLTRNQEYKVQESVTTEEGRRLQPDITILLPDQKYLIIDSKVSLLDYERYNSATDEQEKVQALKRHLQSLRNHIKQLSEKKYEQLYQQGSPDFVLLFVPIEPAFNLAVQQDAELFGDAFERNIVLVSTSTLLATLRTVASLWRQEKQTQNAQEIARQAANMYDKFVDFSNDLIKVGMQLDSTQKTYTEAMKKLSDGKDNLVRKTERLRELGAKGAKQIDSRLLDRSGANESGEAAV
jgi:DNA recombination protein RmuC